MKQATKQLIKRQIFSICACIILSVSAFPQQKSIDFLLENEGFEDIRTITVADTLYATIEDRAHRGTFRGAAAAIKTISDNHSEITHFEVVLTDYKMPQLIVHASKCGDIWNVSVDRQMENALKLLRGVTPQAASTGKIDVTVVPMVTLVNNKLDHLFDYTVRIAPAIATTLWKGARFTVQPIFPILYYTGEYDTKRFIQIGQANLSQQILSTKRWQLSSAAGFFHEERFGIQAKVGYHAFRNLDIYLDGGFTGEANYTKNKGFGIVRNSSQLNYMLRADYYEPYSKLQFELQGGRFLYGDYGGRFDITRHFGEYAIGVYGILTGGENNAGFHFAIPLGGKRQKRNAFVRVRLPEYVSWEYSTRSYFKYWQEKMGQSYITQPDVNHSAHYWEPAFVEEYTERLLNNTFQ